MFNNSVEKEGFFFFKENNKPCWKMDSLHTTLTLAWLQSSEQVLISLKSNKKIFKNIKEN